MPEPNVLTVGALARRFGCSEQRVRRLFTTGVLPEPPRAGPYRLIPVEDIPKVEAALNATGKFTSAASK